MQPLIRKLQGLIKQIDEAYAKLDIDQKKIEINQISDELSRADIWNNPNYAQAKSQKLASLNNLVDPWITLKAQVTDLIELIEVGAGDDSLEAEFLREADALFSDYERLSIDLMFSGEKDANDAIIRITAGVGGTDAQDWSEMLERMYLRWAEKNNVTAKIVERSEGDEAGIKTSVIEMSGSFVYGKMRSEHGVHRLVRLSPFNSDNLRQTSFSLVEVLPQIDNPDEISLDDKDLKIDVYRSGGHGGQSVNTTDSAVRITHIPTGIVVAIQNERSQLQNRETAMKILKAKLVQLQIEQHAASVAELKAGESANWGSQIRNYVMHPYTLVKDTRTKYEDRDIKSVLDGKIDGFIEAYLMSPISKQ